MLRRVSLMVVLAAGCSPTQPDPVLEPPAPGLLSSPRWLTFTCAEPGCDQTLTATVTVVGPRSLAIKRVLLSDTSRTDFALTLDRTPPFVLDPDGGFGLKVRFRPDGDPRLGDIDVIATYTDASVREGTDRVPPGELRVPLVRRLIGEPTMNVSPTSLMFGAVAVGQRKVVPLTIANAGFGNVGLVLTSVESDRPDVTFEDLPSMAILPSHSVEVSAVLLPTREEIIQGFITVKSADPLAPVPKIPFIGTSIGNATLVASPGSLDFGELPVGSSTQARIRLSNLGGRSLVVSNVELTPPGAAVTLTLDVPPEVRTASLAPLASALMELTVAASASAGPFDARIRITSNASSTPVLEIPVVGLVTEPAIRVAPAAIDFGRVPRGWVVAQPVEIENVGYGDLVITTLGMVVGSSSLFGLVTVPELPLTLRHAERVGLEVQFRSEAEATFHGILAAASNDPDQPFVELPITAVGASCSEGCPISHGSPSCTTGVCQIGSCDPGHYDTNQSAADGCECAEIGADPAGFCANAPFLGTLADDGSRTTFTGLVPEPGDEDLLRFFAKDESQLFSDDFDVRVRLESADPGIRFCIFRYNVAEHESACILDNESCPGAARSYRREGSTGSEDGADFTIRVFRTNNSAPSCASYTLFMSNG